MNLIPKSTIDFIDIAAPILILDDAILESELSLAISPSTTTSWKIDSDGL